MLQGLNSKLHAVCDGQGRPIMMFLSEGQLSDHKVLICCLPAFQGKRTARRKVLWQRLGWWQRLVPRSPDRPGISPRANRKVQHPSKAQLCKQRHRIQNLCGRIKDWRRVATRYGRCDSIFMSAISIAANGCYGSW